MLAVAVNSSSCETESNEKTTTAHTLGAAESGALNKLFLPEQIQNKCLQKDYTRKSQYASNFGGVVTFYTNASGMIHVPSMGIFILLYPNICVIIIKQMFAMPGCKVRETKYASNRCRFIGHIYLDNIYGIRIGK